jgi:hypothetical protein
VQEELRPAARALAALETVRAIDAEPDLARAQELLGR